MSKSEKQQYTPAREFRVLLAEYAPSTGEEISTEIRTRGCGTVHIARTREEALAIFSQFEDWSAIIIGDLMTEENADLLLKHIREKNPTIYILSMQTWEYTRKHQVEKLNATSSSTRDKAASKVCELLYP
jgi:hypothetical protein